MKLRIFSLAAKLAPLLLVGAVSVPPVLAQTFPYHECHLETGSERPTYASMTFKVTAPNCTVQNWLFCAPVPPELPGQRKPRASLAVEGARPDTKTQRELSGERRVIMSSVVPASTTQLQHQLTVKVNYWTSEVPRHLVSGKDGHQSAPSYDASTYLSTSDTYDFNSSAFQNWLTTNQLRRRGWETDLDFAWRAFLTLRDKYTYKYISTQDRRASTLCQANATDCGGISYLFISTLRANQIPARARVGRWTNANTTGDQCHVKSEFYARDHGWIPMELSGAISNKASDPMNFFGQENGDFMTLHVDTDLVIDSIWFGKSKLREMQFPAYWATGSGTLNGSSQQTDWRAQPIASYQ